MRRLLSRIAAPLLFAAALLAAPAIRAAAPPWVAVARPATEDAAAREAATRIAAELRASGFEVIEVQGDDAAATPREEAPFATIEVITAPGGPIAEVRFPAGDTPETRRLEPDRGQSATDPGALAIRAVELLRARRLSLQAGPRPPTAPGAPSATPRAPPPRSPRAVPRSRSAGSPPHRAESPPSRPRPVKAETPADAPIAGRPPPPAPAVPMVEAALGVLYGPGGLGVALGPTLTLTCATRPLDVRLTWMTALSLRDFAGTAGSASIRQDLLTLEASRPLLSPDRRLVPAVSAGLGIYHLRADGAARPPYIGHAAHLWVAAFLVGASATARLTERAAVRLGAEALLLLPEPSLRIAGEPVARAGIPVVWATLGLVLAEPPGRAFP